MGVKASVEVEGVEVLSSAEVCENAEISYRTLDNWERSGLIEPVVKADGQGTRRLWDVSVVAEIIDLKKRIAQCPLKHPGHDQEDYPDG